MDIIIKIYYHAVFNKIQELHKVKDLSTWNYLLHF